MWGDTTPLLGVRALPRKRTGRFRKCGSGKLLAPRATVLTCAGHCACVPVVPTTLVFPPTNPQPIVRTRRSISLGLPRPQRFRQQKLILEDQEKRRVASSGLSCPHRSSPQPSGEWKFCFRPHSPRLAAGVSCLPVSACSHPGGSDTLTY